MARSSKGADSFLQIFYTCFRNLLVILRYCVRQRLDLLRLTAAEREDITREMERGRKQGMGGLKNAVQSGQTSQSRTNCPICDGSFGACKLPPR